ncbi:hypothetical protein NQ318_002212 [Aromia moschata]|uniref:HTH OST-type domain-containing protein n=1 Tax=Aromia moschata TaxID=1265417 RepID=A0AAV8Z4W1_9CUCU|nr:hypothetical protein NQ318_002212 [Aromia moschata]
MEKLRSDVISSIRACLVSTKGKVQLRQLDADYKTLVGERIPFFKLGFKKLEDFIQSEPSLVISRSGGEVYVDAKTSEKSAHITELVERQKNEKEKSVEEGSSICAQPKPGGNDKLATEGLQSLGPAAVSHNQFVNRPSYDKPSVASKVVIPETSSLYKNPQLQRQNSQPKRADINTRLQLTAPVAQDSRQVVNNGHTVTISNNVNDTLAEDTCSPLSSTKKRITKKMSEINIDRDSGNSSPVSDMAESAGQASKVSKYSYTSYPKEFNNPEDARNCCAQEALNDLIPKYGRRKSLLLASDKDILERIPPLLEKHNHGIWAWQLQLDYADKYNEQLPVDWLKTIDSSPCIQIEKCLKNYVLRHCKPGDVLQKGQNWNKFLTLSDVSVPSNTVQFGDDGKLYAEVTCVMSANEIWCRQCLTEESETYNEMIGRMELFYNLNENELKAEKNYSGRLLYYKI